MVLGIFFKFDFCLSLESIFTAGFEFMTSHCLSFQEAEGTSLRRLLQLQGLLPVPCRRPVSHFRRAWDWSGGPGAGLPLMDFEIH